MDYGSYMDNNSVIDTAKRYTYKEVELNEDVSDKILRDYDFNDADMVDTGDINPSLGPLKRPMFYKTVLDQKGYEIQESEPKTFGVTVSDSIMGFIDDVLNKPSNQGYFETFKIAISKGNRFLILGILLIIISIFIMVLKSSGVEVD